MGEWSPCGALHPIILFYYPTIITTTSRHRVFTHHQHLTTFTTSEDFKHSISTTSTAMSDWESLAAEKRDSINALIPKSWLLDTPLPSTSEQRDVTGKYIQQFLAPREVEITETDATGIVKNTTSGVWKAREVAEAFCHRAALAHQFVKQSGLPYSMCIL